MQAARQHLLAGATFTQQQHVALLDALSMVRQTFCIPASRVIKPPSAVG